MPHWRRITGITHNVASLPDEGLIHHVRQWVSFDWEKYESGRGGPSRSFMEHAVNTEEYSHEIEMRLGINMDGESSGSTENKKSLQSSWNGETW